MTTQLLGDRLHLARRNPLHIHLRQRRHQCPLWTLIALEQLGRESPRTILRNAQFELAYPRDQRSAVITRPIAQPVCAPLALLGTQRLRHLRFEHLLEGRSNQHPQELLVLR